MSQFEQEFLENQAGRNAGYRLRAEGYSLHNLYNKKNRFLYK